MVIIQYSQEFEHEQKNRIHKQFLNNFKQPWEILKNELREYQETVI